MVIDLRNMCNVCCSDCFQNIKQQHGGRAKFAINFSLWQVSLAEYWRYVYDIWYTDIEPGFLNFMIEIPFTWQHLEHNDATKF
jgi:hypothetical protein